MAATGPKAAWSSAGPWPWAIELLNTSQARARWRASCARRAPSGVPPISVRASEASCTAHSSSAKAYPCISAKGSGAGPRPTAGGGPPTTARWPCTIRLEVLLAEGLVDLQVDLLDAADFPVDARRRAPPRQALLQVIPAGVDPRVGVAELEQVGRARRGLVELLDRRRQLLRVLEQVPPVGSLPEVPLDVLAEVLHPIDTSARRGRPAGSGTSSVKTWWSCPSISSTRRTARSTAGEEPRRARASFRWCQLPSIPRYARRTCAGASRSCKLSWN